MNETKTAHTPGPWEARVFRNGDGFGIFAPSKEHSITSSNLYEHTSYTGYFNAEETEANARLIAAAPELLKALEAIVKIADAAETGKKASALDRVQELAETALAAAGRG